jgi:hypothetical protein
MKHQQKELHLSFIVFVFFVTPAGPLFCQTAARLEVILNKPAVTWQQAVSFILDAANPDGLSETLSFANPQEAFRFALEKKWLPKNAALDDAADFIGIAHLLMHSFDLKGGISYSLAHSAHHAYRELGFLGVFPGNVDPRMTVSGQQLILVVSRLLSLNEVNYTEAMK